MLALLPVALFFFDVPLLAANTATVAWSLLWSLDGEASFLPPALFFQGEMAAGEVAPAQLVSFCVTAVITTLCGFLVASTGIEIYRAIHHFDERMNVWYIHRWVLRRLQLLVFLLVGMLGIWLLCGYAQSCTELCGLKSSIHAHMLGLGLPEKELPKRAHGMHGRGNSSDVSSNNSNSDISNSSWHRLEKAIDVRLANIHKYRQLLWQRQQRHNQQHHQHQQMHNSNDGDSDISPGAASAASEAEAAAAQDLINFVIPSINFTDIAAGTVSEQTLALVARVNQKIPYIHLQTCATILRT